MNDNTDNALCDSLIDHGCVFVSNTISSILLNNVSQSEH